MLGDNASSETRVFDDRQDAGRQLAAKLMPYRDQDPIVLALPRGGVVVGFEIAEALRAPLDVLVARKLGAPGQPELGIGAIATGGVIVLDALAVRYLGISQPELDRMTAAETREMERRLQLYRGDRPAPAVEDKTAILVDDGLATGVTARAALRSLRQLHPRRIVLAVPVCAPQTAEAIRPEVEDLVCLLQPEQFRAVGLWYRDFDQVPDSEVIALLQRANQDAGIGVQG
ncbi:MAG TPA: phosphoribosyltransferase [Chthonomonadaceae bacterium]|nr:phosphoribosyltransferase [Chthonomonadaceae bacterium]